MQQQARLVPRPGQQDRGRDTFERILDTTERLLLNRRFEEITTNDLCIEANVSSSSLYARFPSKDAILLALIQRYRDRIDESVERAAELLVPLSSPDDLHGVLRSVLREVIEFARDNDHLERELAAHALTRDQVTRIYGSNDVIELAVQRLELSGVLSRAQLRRTEFAIRAAAAIVHRAVGSDLRFTDMMAMSDGELIDEVAAMIAAYLEPVLFGTTEHP